MVPTILSSPFYQFVCVGLTLALSTSSASQLNTNGKNRNITTSKSSIPDLSLSRNPLSIESNSTCLKSHTELADVEFSCKSETLDMLESQLDTFVLATAHRGDPLNNFRLALRDTHLEMRENYAKLIASVGRNIYPLIIASDCENSELCGVGSTYKLYLKDGSMKRSPKVHDGFEIFKYLSHMVLGVFSIVSPYFKASYSTSWIPSLTKFQSKIKSVSSALSQANQRLDPSDSQIANQMIKIVLEYTEKSIYTQRVDESTYVAFANRLAPYIDSCMQRAARHQAQTILPVLKRWKTELGEDWKNTFAVIPTVWPVSKINVRLQMLEQVMDFEQMKNKVLVVEGARNDEEALTTLGRIVADRALALLVFGGIDDDNARDHAFSLSTRRDILSSHAGSAIKANCQKTSKLGSNCPMARQFATMIQ